MKTLKLAVASAALVFSMTAGAHAATATGKIQAMNCAQNPVPVTINKDGGGILNLKAQKAMLVSSSIENGGKVEVTYSGATISAIKKAGGGRGGSAGSAGGTCYSSSAAPADVINP